MAEVTSDAVLALVNPLVVGIVVVRSVRQAIKEIRETLARPVRRREVYAPKIAAHKVPGPLVLIKRGVIQARPTGGRTNAHLNPRNARPG